jgi:hypothetical protein
MESQRKPSKHSVCSYWSNYTESVCEEIFEKNCFDEVKKIAEKIRTESSN